jgi:hypothetical protein
MEGAESDDDFLIYKEDAIGKFSYQNTRYRLGFLHMALPVI